MSKAFNEEESGLSMEECIIAGSLPVMSYKYYVNSIFHIHRTQKFRKKISICNDIIIVISKKCYRHAINMTKNAGDYDVSFP
jgi:hypothetical protein